MVMLAYDEDGKPVDWWYGEDGLNIEAGKWYEATTSLREVPEDDERVVAHYGRTGEKPKPKPMAVEEAARALLAKMDSTTPEAEALRSALEGGAA